MKYVQQQKETVAKVRNQNFNTQHEQVRVSKKSNSIK